MSYDFTPAPLIPKRILTGAHINKALAALACTVSVSTNAYACCIISITPGDAGGGLNILAGNILVNDKKDISDSTSITSANILYTKAGDATVHSMSIPPATVSDYSVGDQEYASKPVSFKIGTSTEQLSFTLHINSGFWRTDYPFYGGGGSNRVWYLLGLTSGGVITFPVDVHYSALSSPTGLGGKTSAVAMIPEPETWVLALAGLIAPLVAFTRKHRQTHVQRLSTSF
jgi:hypothetical protein